MTLNLMVTLWPDFPHFSQFARDSRLSGIRLNSAMIDNVELKTSLDILRDFGTALPLWFDVKGRQLRIERVNLNDKYLDITLNHPIQVKTPTPVLFKAGEDQALLLRTEEGGRRLIFQGGPHWMVRAGESIHIRHPSLQTGRPLFTNSEVEKIAQCQAAGFTRYFLSYVGSQSEVDEFQELVGKDAEIYLKIEDKKGLDFVANKFKKQPNIRLVAACGDLYVETERPHEILGALQLLIDKDPEACVGSRMLLSVINKREVPPGVDPKTFQKITCNPVPSFADFAQLAWLAEIGYNTMMLCDELCLHGELMATAIGAFDAFRKTYKKRSK